MACNKLVTSCYLNQWWPEFCHHIESSGLNAWPVNQGDSPVLTAWDPCCQDTQYEPFQEFWLWCSVVNCRREQIHKFKTEYLLIWQKYLSTWSSIKYFGLQVQVSTKYFWISNDQVQVSTKYSIICIKYQVPSTSTLLDPNPDEDIDQYGSFTIPSQIMPC